MWIFLIFLQLPFAQADNTMPEFECTAHEIKSLKANQILGNKKYPSLSLRKFASGKWQLNTTQGKATLDENQVSKVVGLDFKSVSYRINYKKWILKVDLVGTPPSRNGSLYSFNIPPLISEELSRLTCH